MKIIKTAAIALLSLLLLAAMIVYFFFKSTLPALDGVLPGCGVSGETLIERGPRGVPLIRARGEDDLYFAVGFVHAQDRLFQMDLQRRAAWGRLAEVLGERALDQDVLQHLLQAEAGIERSTRALPPGLRRVLESYCRGVNQFLTGQPLPPEFHFLDYVPAPWRVQDVLAVLKYLESALAWSGGELGHARLLAAMDPARARPWLALPRPDPGRSFWPRALAEPALARLLALESAPAASNAAAGAWVVAGDRGAGGRPILANDFPWPPQLPALFYQVAARAPALELSGNTLPGVPFLFSGRSGEIAWGVVPARRDCLDYFLLERHPQNRRLYRCDGHWLELESMERTIACRGRGPVRLRLDVSRFGPVLEAAGGLLAVRSLLPHRSTAAAALYGMNRARNAREFAAALRRFSAPALGVVFADRNGGIGAGRAGMEPVRGRGDGLLPLRTASLADGWRGLANASFVTVPDPNRGWLTAGERAAGERPPPRFFSFDADPDPGAERLAGLLAASERLDATAAARLQRDVRVTGADTLIEIVRRLPLVSERAQRARDLLASWDLQADAGEGASCFYEFAGRLGAALLPAATGAVPAGSLSLPRLAAALRQPGLLHPGELAAAVESSLDGAYAALRGSRGGPPEGLNWEHLHEATLRHPLGGRFPLRPLFQRGPFPVSGGEGCLQDTGGPGFAVARLAAYRMVLDLSDPSACLLVYPGGQSGHPLSPAYDDQLGAYLDPKPQLMENRGRRVHRLRLLPAPR